jgi:hypothetical protein
MGSAGLNRGKEDRPLVERSNLDAPLIRHKGDGGCCWYRSAHWQAGCTAHRNCLEQHLAPAMDRGDMVV